MHTQRGTTIPHSFFADSDCCGCLTAMICDTQADIRCNECDALILLVETADLESTLGRMELSMDVASAVCSRCGAVNLFPGFSQVLAFVCSEWSEGVNMADRK